MGVVAAIFMGLSLGSWSLGAAIHATNRPGLWYGVLEAVVGGWGLLLAFALPWLMPAIAVLIGEQPSPAFHWLSAFLVPTLLLLPATVAMGASLPAAVRQAETAGRALELIYAANTAGAVLGVLATVFWLLPLLGLQTTAILTAGLNLLCAALALWYWRQPLRPAAGRDATAQGPASLPAREQGASPFSRLSWRVPRHAVAPLLLLAGCGLLGIGYETLCVRLLSQVSESTVYSQATMLAVFLAGTALGAALQHRAASRRNATAPVGQLVATAVAVALGVAALAWADRIAATTLGGLLERTGPTLGGEALAAAAAMLLPSIGMGALFAAACRWAEARGLVLGRAMAFNTGAAALAPAVVGVLLMPALGSGTAAALLVAGYLAMASACAAGAARRRTGAAAAAVLLAALCLPPLRLIDLGPGDHLRLYREGVMASVSITEDAAGVLRLRINNRAQEGSSAAGLVEQRLALIPLLLHPDPRRALFLGLGTGYTAQVAALDEQLRVDAVELLPEVVAASRTFMRLPHAPQPLAPPRVIEADARRFILSGSSTYDVVVADLFHPARSGAGSLYTVEHFRALRQRLAPGGVVCQWLALHQMEIGTLRHVVAAFREVFPSAVAVLASNSLDTPVIGLIARPDEPFPGAAPITRRRDAAERPYATVMGPSRLVDGFAVLGSIVAGPRGLQRLAGDAAANRDDRPVVSQAAPWDVYAPRSVPRQRLSALLEMVGEVDAGAMPVAWADRAESAAMAAYWQARRRYLELGMTVRLDGRAHQALQQIEVPLQSLLELSPQFTPAADALNSLHAARAR